MTLEIDQNQAELLRQVLASQVKELSIESARTDSHAYHEDLVRRRRVLESLLAKLMAPEPPDVGLANRLS